MGRRAGGGSSSGVSSQISSGVVDIYSTLSAFAALKSDGSVVTWGSSSGGGDSSSVSSNLSSGVIDIQSTYYAFAARKSDGSFVTWGHSSYGADSSSIDQSDLTNKVSKIFTGYDNLGGSSSDEVILKVLNN